MTAFPPRGSARGRLLAWLLFLAAAGAALLGCGRLLPGPPTAAQDILPWVDDHGTALMVVSVLRLVGLAAVTYLAILTAVLGVEQRKGSVTARRLIEVGTPRRWRVALEALAGAGWAAGLTATLVPAAGADGPVAPTTVAASPNPDGVGDDIAVMVPLPPVPLPTVPLPSGRHRDGEPAPPTSNAQASGERPRDDRRPTTSTPSTTSAPGPEAKPTATMHSMDDEPMPSPEGERPANPLPAPTAPPAPADDEQWTVELGDHLWGIAAEVVGEGGAAPDDVAIARYWTRLIDANRPRLVDPGNPDLLLPGQVLVLPPRAA